MTYEQLPLFPPADEPRKRCSHCREMLPFEAFSKNRARPDGLQHICKTCFPALKREYYKKNGYKSRAYVKEWRQQNPDKVKAQKKRHYARHKSDYIERTSIRRKLNPDIRKEEGKRRYQRYPERFAYLRRLRTARERGAGGTYTQAEIETRYHAQDGLCQWCSKPLNGIYNADHVVPIARGGSNRIDNIVLTCERCNKSKGARFVFTEWQPPNPLRKD